MRATKRFSGDTSASRYFQLAVLIWMSCRLERSFAIYRSTSFSLSLSVPLSISDAAVITSPSSRFVLFRLFSIGDSSARTLSVRRNLLIASFLDGKGRCAASFLAEEISGPDHAIDFHAPAVRGFSLRLPNHPIVCRVCQAIWTGYFVHRLGMLQFNRIPIILLIQQDRYIKLSLKIKKEKFTREFLRI